MRLYPILCTIFGCPKVVLGCLGSSSDGRFGSVEDTQGWNFGVQTDTSMEAWIRKHFLLDFGRVCVTLHTRNRIYASVVFLPTSDRFRTHVCIPKVSKTLPIANLCKLQKPCFRVEGIAKIGVPDFLVRYRICFEKHSVWKALCSFSD